MRRTRRRPRSLRSCNHPVPGDRSSCRWVARTTIVESVGAVRRQLSPRRRRVVGTSPEPRAPIEQRQKSSGGKSGIRFGSTSGMPTRCWSYPMGCSVWSTSGFSRWENRPTSPRSGRASSTYRPSATSWDGRRWSQGVASLLSAHPTSTTGRSSRRSAGHRTRWRNCHQNDSPVLTRFGASGPPAAPSRRCDSRISRHRSRSFARSIGHLPIVRRQDSRPGNHRQCGGRHGSPGFRSHLQEARVGESMAPPRHPWFFPWWGLCGDGGRR